ncbi:hypothetical protein QEG52_000536 [Stenotrophomonas maltophilia]|nr:hypothetical protein [Stenotrophomonas maltophilia]
MGDDKITLADVQPGGRVRLGDQTHVTISDDLLSSMAYAIPGAVETTDKAKAVAARVVEIYLSAQPSPGGQHSVWLLPDDARIVGVIADSIERGKLDHPGFYRNTQLGEVLRRVLSAALAAHQPVGRSFQSGVSEWMGQCFLPSLYSNMTERGDRLLEEVLELLQAHGYDRARVPTLVDYVFGRPVGEPVQEVGGVMVTLAGYCWVAGIDMHAAGDAELARINQPDVMAKIRAKQEAKNALHFDTPLPGGPAATDAWPREGDLVRYGDGASALAIRLEPHAGGWHGYQCCGGYTFFTKAYRPSRADMDTWLDCAKYRDERTKVADNRVAHEMYLIDSHSGVSRD